MNQDKLSMTKSSSFRIHTQPTSSSLLAEKNKYLRYDTSLFHKTRFHLKPLKQNPELFTRVDSIATKIKKLKQPMSKNYSQSKLDGKYENQKKRDNTFLPHPINIRNNIIRLSSLEKNIQTVLKQETKVLVTAKKWIIFDMQSKQTLKGYKHKKEHDVASLSKILTFYTAYMIIQQYFLSIQKLEMIADQEDEKIMGTKINIKRETTVSLEDMLYAMMLGSANNAATIIATNLGSLVRKKRLNKYFTCYDIPNQSKQRNMQTFIQLMNSYAMQLGLSTTKIHNAHGMAKNVSNALDIAVITSQCYKIPLFSKICVTKNYQITLNYIDDFGEYIHEKVNIVNTNKLLWIKSSGCIGGKTGCNVNGGESLSVCYEGNIIIVVLGCATREDKFADAEKLIGWLNKKLQF